MQQYDPKYKEGKNLKKGAIEKYVLIQTRLNPIEIFSCLNELKNEYNLVSWPQFVLKFKDIIVEDYKLNCERLGLADLRAIWIGRVTHVCNDTNIILFDKKKDNWHLITKLIYEALKDSPE
ncbi:unnamed protein product [Mucor hiemalis]